MAVIWRRRQKSRLYEVRTAGRTLRLYTNGVLHTQFNQHTPVTGSVWDLLFIPAFFYPATQIKRILILGVGGGAVIRQFNHFFEKPQITGVEINATHLYVAKRFFDVQTSNVVLHAQDAKEFLCDSTDEKRFDIIIDDLFDDDSHEPERAVEVTREWSDLVLRRLAPGGMVVTNFGCMRELRQSGYMNSHQRQFKTRFRLSSALLENVIGVFLKQHVTSRQLRENLKRNPLLDPTRKSCRLDYRIRRI